MSTTTEIQELAKATLLSRLGRANVVGTTSKGRVITEMVGEPCENERQWRQLQQVAKLARLRWM